MAKGIEINSSFDVGVPLPIDSRMVLTKSEMLTMNDKVMPPIYFCMCKDDGGFYLYTKESEPNSETGKFKFIFDNTHQQLSQEEILSIIDDNVATTEDMTAILNRLSAMVGNVSEEYDSFEEIADTLIKLQQTVNLLETKESVQALTFEEIDSIFG